jgi:cytochrome c biogenesis protein CcdA/thiol-disulfide isomerase/thioredoxin
MKKIVTAVLLLILLSLFATAAEPEVCDINEGTCSVTPDEAHDTHTTVDDIFAGHDEGDICVIYFYSETCGHCKNLKPFIDDIEEKYPEIALARLEVRNYENFQLYNQFCTNQGYGGKEIPLIAIGNQYLVGEDQIRDGLEDAIETMINLDPSERVCPLTNSSVCFTEENGSEELVGKITMGAIFVAGLIDGINPCAFAVLILLMTVLFEINMTKRKIIKVGVSYIGAFVLTNILLGVAVYWFSDALFGGTTVTLKIAAGIALVAGLINIKDFFWYGKGVTLKIPENVKKIVKPLVKKASVPAVALLGAIIAFFEAPCSASIYYAVIEMLRSHTATIGTALPYILIYNLMFVMPLIILFFLVYTGKNVAQAERWRLSHRKWMKLAIGTILVLFALAVFFNLI